MFLLRALAVWLVIIVVEIVHGILRTLLLARLVGDFEARQIGVFVGSILILTIAYFFIRWIEAGSNILLFAVGLIWLVLTLAFELSFGRFVLNFSWDRILSDYNIAQGGLLPFGLIILLFAPLIAAKIRGSESNAARTDFR